MEKRILAADRAGLQCAIHAIGDRANAIILDIFDAAAAENGPRDRRFRIEHAQHLRPADIARFAKLGVIASVQPYHAVDDGRWAERRSVRSGPKTTYAFRSFLDAGATLAFGSDWPVAPMDPAPGHRRGGHPADDRRREPGRLDPGAEDLRGRGGPGFDARTARSRSSPRPRRARSQPGRSPISSSSTEIRSPFRRSGSGTLRVRMTIVGGEIVFRR